MTDTDYELGALLSLDGQEFRFESGYCVKIRARLVTATKARPHGIKYSLTLHDPKGNRIYGMDNAHRAKGQAEYDHRHIHAATRIVPYVYEGPVELLADFYREVERILKQRGAS